MNSGRPITYRDIYKKFKTIYQEELFNTGAALDLKRFNKMIAIRYLFTELKQHKDEVMPAHELQLWQTCFERCEGPFGDYLRVAIPPELIRLSIARINVTDSKGFGLLFELAEEYHSALYEKALPKPPLKRNNSTFQFASEGMEKLSIDDMNKCAAIEVPRKGV